MTTRPAPHLPRPRVRWRPAAALALALLALLLARPASAHTGLQSASPGDGDSLSVAPETLRLTFFGAVDLPLASVRLVGPDGAEVGLAPLERASDSERVILARIAGPLRAGPHMVHWQIVGADGHPVRGEYTFHVEAGAQGLAAEPVGPAAAAPPAPEPVAGAPAPHAMDAPSFDAGSPLYAAVRWLTFLGLLGAIGAVAFRAPVLSLVARQEDGAGRRVIEPAARTAATVGLAAVALLAVALALRLFAQSHAVFGGGPLEGGRLGMLLGGSTWGWGWILQAAGTALALAGFALARGGNRAGWVAAGIATVALGVSPALSGHAAASEATGPAMLADALHVLGAGGWLGSLLAVVLVGIPAALRLPGEERGPAVRALVNAFSPAALAFAALVVATGVFAAWIHLQSVPALWESAYGRTLLLKLAVLAVVFGTGAYNWLRVRPALGGETAAHRLRRSASVELAAGALVLAVTAFLVATPPPAEAPDAPAVAVER